MSTERQPGQSRENPELRVDVARQVVSLVRGGSVEREWAVSTSRFGLGTEAGSNRTPTGNFFVSEKIGAGAPEWAEFKSRQPTGLVSGPGGEEDRILTRILWLGGADPANANTKERYIYFHGTNREDLIGTPASHGCVRMRNADIVELFDLVPESARVVIG
jgi:lipoprotein-anchoring transpeptidase ErfK/SrfK